MENVVSKELAVQEEDELEVVTREWLVEICGERENSTSEESESEEFEEWYGIQENSPVQDEGDSFEVTHEEEALEVGDLDVSDSESLIGDDGNKVSKEEVIQSLGVIWQRNWKKIEKDMTVWEKLEEYEI